MAPMQNIVKHQENKGQDVMDSLIHQAKGKEPFLSFSRASDSSFQLIQLLNSFDPQGSGKICKSSEENCTDLKENSLDHHIGLNSISSKKNGIMESTHSLKGYGEFSKGSNNTSAMQPLKIPEAVVAFAQAAAKANVDLKNVCQMSKSDISGWPLLSPSKRQLHKCDKCSREFCSSINYRRHIRVHRRSLNAHRDSPKNRHFLSEFWDKANSFLLQLGICVWCYCCHNLIGWPLLSVDEAKELASLKSVTVEEISGSSVIKALSTWIRRPASLASLPHMYVKAGLTLLDVVQACPSVFPVSSQELFGVLDDASENTFLCAGTASSVQKYVFDGEAVKNALEIKNLVALTSFLIEKELVRTWLADKDAEALRCQKLLVEEEEYALKRQAKILERKKLKKMRQKEQKAKETSSFMKVDFNNPPPEFTDCAGSTECCSPRALSEGRSSEASINQEQQLLQYALLGDVGEAKLMLSIREENCEKNKDHLRQIANGYLGSDEAVGEKYPGLLVNPEDAEQDLVNQTQRVNGHQQQNHVRSFYAKSIKNSLNGSCVGNFLTARSSNLRHNNRDLKSATPGNGHKVWTIKLRPDNEEDCKISIGFADREPRDQSVASNGSEVLIGSINVTLKNCEGRHQYTVLRPQFQEKPLTPDSSLSSANRTTVKLWRSANLNENDSSVENDRIDGKADACATQSAERISADQSCLAFRGTVDVDCEKHNAPMFSCEGAKAFLTQRWKEAIVGERVVVVSSPETEASDYPGLPELCFAKPTSPTADFTRWSILGRAENGLLAAGSIDPSSTVALKPKILSKAEKSSRFKFVPKRKNTVSEE